MMKKLISFICCLAPFSAVAATITENPGTGNSYSTTQLNATTDTYVFQSGNGIVVGSGGINVLNGMYIGRDNPGGVSDGLVYAESGIDKPYTIRSDGNISIGTILNVLSGYSLGIGVQTVGSQVATATFGDITADGALTIQDIKTFSSGAISSADTLSITADTITAGAINSTAGNTTLNTTGALTMEQLVVDGNATTNVNAGSINSGNIQNISGTMNVVLSGDLTSTGSIENSGTAMTIKRQAETDVVNVVVDGTMKNDSTAGTMTLNIDSLKVAGGDSLNPSFVNKGNLNATVKGETYLEYGFDLSAMTTDNTFSLDTGTLTFGANMPQDSWLQVFSNDLASFNLAVRQGSVVANDIINGASNTAANMTLLGQSVNADSVENRGTMSITATESTGAVNIAGAITGAAGSNTNIISAGGLTAGGSASNSGKMVLNGNQVNLQAVSNNGIGSELEISSLTDTTGKITVAGNIANTLGTTLVEAREIDIQGLLTNNSGTTTIRGSDSNGGSVAIGSISVLGGAVNVNALVGSAAITNGLSVTGGAFNVGSDTYALTVGDSVQINGDVSFSDTAAVGAGNVNVAASGTRGFVLTSTNGTISVDGDINSTDANIARSGTFVASTIDVGGNITAENKGVLVFGDSNTTKLTVGTDAGGGAVAANNGGTIEIYADDTDVASLTEENGKFIVHGSQLTATAGDINIEDGVWFDGTEPAVGLVVKDTTTLTLETVAAGKDIDIAGGTSVAAGNALNLISANDATVSGVIKATGTVNVTAANVVKFDNNITSAGTFTANGATINAAGANLTNTGNANLTANNSGAINFGNITNSASLTINGGVLTLGALESSAGVADITGTSLSAALLDITGGKMTINSASVAIAGNAHTAGDLMQGGAATGMLNLTRNNTVFSANNLTVDGNMLVNGNTAAYNIVNAVSVKDVTVAGGAAADVSAKTIAAADVNVSGSGTLALRATDGIDLGVVNNSGALTLNSGNALTTLTSFTNTATGTVLLSGTGMTATMPTEDMPASGVFTTPGTLYQNFGGTISAGDVNVMAANYAITASNVNVAAINQVSGMMQMYTSDITVGGDISAQNLRIAANPATDWLNAKIDGNVSGGVQFIGLEHMTIGGNYVFNDNSIIHAAILPYAAGVSDNTSIYNYWATVSLNDDKTLGQITNGANAEPLISVNGQFVSDVSVLGTGSSGGALKNGQVGIDLFDVVDQGTAIWLLHADNGLNDLATKVRNLNVNFCNADGSLCFNYLDSLNANNSTTDDLPAYLSVRDTDGDGNSDSIYIVFDPRFGGPVEVFKIQPIVGREDDHTKGEYVSAGALDDLVAGQLRDNKFYNRTPIEAIPLVFKGTNMETLANELYNRMEQYNLDRNGAGLARFSRLFQVRELEQIAGSISLNEHTSFRDFEDHMFDEFIWNRHRNLKKAWADADFGTFRQKVSDSKTVDGNRFSISGGFDWQDSPTLILGLAARVSHMSSENSDEIDLGYKPGQSIAGRVHMDVADTNIGLGGYLMKTLGLKTRAYGNAFLDVHVFDVSREQNYVDNIDGRGTAFSLISEWGLLHDWLNQYIVGNMYARVGYNFGFSVKEKVAGDEYMRLKSDGYLVFTPGYSLIAQKRIYPSSWFQIRPYASIGVEYDVLGAPDEAKYKFAPASSYTKYDIDIDPLWANIGGGMEFISATGIQVGLDYRYQYNSDIQMHKIRLSGSYRF